MTGRRSGGGITQARQKLTRRHGGKLLISLRLVTLDSTPFLYHKAFLNRVFWEYMYRQ